MASEDRRPAPIGTIQAAIPAFVGFNVRLGGIAERVSLSRGVGTVDLREQRSPRAEGFWAQQIDQLPGLRRPIEQEVVDRRAVIVGAVALDDQFDARTLTKPAGANAAARDTRTHAELDERIENQF